MCDIIIFLTAFTNDEIAEISAAFGAFTFMPLDVRDYDLNDDAIFHETHVPRSSLARLAAPIPEQYEHVVYIDGDVQILGDLSPLIRHDVAPGKILAANDHAFLCASERGEYAAFFRRYLTGIGVDNPSDYFNTGVLAFRRSTWAEMAPAAMAYIREHSVRCNYHDQSALNAVCVGRREVLSPAFNFVSWFSDIDATDFLSPVIVHFTGEQKPWRSVTTRWGDRFLSDYDQIVEKHEVVSKFWRRPSDEEIAAKDAARRSAQLRTRLQTPWRKTMRRARMKRYLADTAFAVG